MIEITHLMNKEPIISIIAICFNHEKYVIETLDSIRNQTYKKIEVLIIDNGSSDNSVALIKNWIKEHNFKCTFIQNKTNRSLIVVISQ